MAAVYPDGPDPMMTTFRVVPMYPPGVPRAPLDGPGRLRDAENGPELREVAELEVGRLDVGRQGLGVAVDPRGGHADRAGAQDVDVGPVAHGQGVSGPAAHPVERGLEDHRLGLAPADLV